MAPLAWFLLGGCGLTGGTDVGERTAGSGSVGERISVDELDQITKNFADRYVLFLANACDDIKANAVSAEQRRNAHRLKLEVAAAAYDIATGPDPVKQLVDMAILVDLHDMVWVEEGQSVRFFGVDLGARLSQAFRAAQGEIWSLAERVMMPEQVEALKAAIQEWRRRHPAVEWVSDTRFDVVAGGDGVTLIGGTLGVLTPASGNITDSIGQSRLLGQRAFYYLKRFPRLLDWQAEAALDNALNVPAASRLIQEAPSILESVAELLVRLNSLLRPSPEALGTEPDPRLAEIQQTLAQGMDLAIAMRQAAESFEISEYMAAAVQFGEAAREASDLLHETRDFAESQSALLRFREVMNTVAGDLGTQARDTTDHAARRAAELIVLSVGLLSVGAGILLWLGRRPRGVPKEAAKGR